MNINFYNILDRTGDNMSRCKQMCDASVYGANRSLRQRSEACDHSRKSFCPDSKRTLWPSSWTVLWSRSLAFPIISLGKWDRRFGRMSYLLTWFACVLGPWNPALFSITWAWTLCKASFLPWTICWRIMSMLSLFRAIWTWFGTALNIVLECRYNATN